MTNLEIVKAEAQIIKTQVEIAKSDLTKSEKIARIILEQRSSTLTSHFDFFKEWVEEQVNENNLPERSSGSFITALKDTDGLLQALNIQEEEYENLVKVFNNITR